MPSTTTPSRAGIIQDQTGERHIPSSVRPDGSERKEIKIRPGYRPPEDVEVYKNRTAEGFRTRGSGGVPGADGLKEVEREKKARNLKKKLKQAKELKEKKEGGASLLPEQFAKVIKITELIRELDSLGFDSEGELKEKEKILSKT